MNQFLRATVAFGIWTLLALGVKTASAQELPQANAMKTVDKLTSKERSVIAQAIWKYPNEKYISVFEEGDEAKIQKSAKAMSNFLDKLKH